MNRFAWPVFGGGSGGGGEGGLNVAVVVEPIANPLAVTVGDEVTLTLGSFSNATSVIGVLTQDGVNRTAEINDERWSPSQDEPWTWTVTASGQGGPIVRTFNGTVEAQVIPPEGLSPADYHTYADGAAAPEATGAEVTTFVAQGSGAPTFTLAGAGAAPVKEADALRFSVGRYFMADGLAIPAGDGFILAIDVTFHQITGTQSGIVLGAGATALATLRAASATAQLNVGAGINGAAANVSLGRTLVVGDRVQMFVEFDRVAGTYRYLNLSTGLIVTVPITFGSVIAASRISLGQGGNISIHRAAVVGRAQGQPWATTLEEVIADFDLAGGGETAPLPGTFTAVRFYPADGQSLEQGPNIGGTAAPVGGQWRTVLVDPRVRMLTGHRRADLDSNDNFVAINTIASPLLKGYNTDFHATGDTQAVATGSVTPGFITALDLVESLPSTTIIAYQFNSASGLSIVNLDSSTAEGTTTIPWDNGEFWIEEAVAFYGGLGLSMTCPGFGLNQGEAEVTRERGWWLTRAEPYVAERRAQLQAATGQAELPVLYLNQTGGYMLKEPNQPHLVVLDQLDLVRDTPGAVLAVVNYAIPVSNSDGRGVHFGVLGNAIAGHTRAWAIEETEAGRPFTLMVPETVARVGDTITIPVSIRTDETLTTEVGKYAAYGGDPANLGLEALGGGTITSAAVSGGNIIVQVSGTVTAIRNAMQATGIDYSQFLDANGNGYVTHRSIIRTTLTKPVTSFGGLSLTLTRPVPSFEVLVA